MNIYLRNDKCRIYWLIEQYLKNRIATESFCNEFYYCYGQEINHQDLTILEERAFSELSSSVDRYSPYDDELELGRLYTTSDDIRRAATSAFVELKDNSQIDKLASKLVSKNKSGVYFSAVLLNVNKNAKLWNAFIDTLSLSNREDESLGWSVEVVFIIPGKDMPVSFQAYEIYAHDDIIQIEIALTDIPFPENDPMKAKKIIVGRLRQALEELDAHGVSKSKLSALKSKIEYLIKNWNVDVFQYRAPKDQLYTEHVYADHTKAYVYEGGINDLSTAESIILIDENGMEIV